VISHDDEPPLALEDLLADLVALADVGLITVVSDGDHIAVVLTDQGNDIRTARQNDAADDDWDTALNQEQKP
jgi:hypothetical protein